MSSAPSQQIMFRETQKFSQVWIMVVIYAAVLLVWFGFFQQIIFGKPFGTNPGPDWLMWLLWLLIGIGLPVLFHSLTLIVEVREDCVHIQYVPFINRQIPFDEIETFQARSYQPIREYGGWGIKGWSSKKIAYNVKGNQGVELELINGQRIMIGSQKAEELALAIAHQKGSG